jgi:S-adenosylmethionine decarboxylase
VGGEGELGILRVAADPFRAPIIRAMQGLHLTADLRGCDLAQPALTELDALRALCLAAVQAAALQPVGELFHRFPPAPGTTAPAGITGVVLLAESHLAVHTWPEQAAVTLDVYVSNFGADNTANAHALLDALLAAFRPAHAQRHALRRGGLPAAWDAAA